MKLRTIIFILSSVVLFGSSCNRDNEYSIDEKSNIIPDEFTVNAHINGRVLDASNSPIRDVSVDFENSTVTTDNRGFFKLRDMDISNRGSLVKFTKTGYFPGYKFVQAEEEENSYISVKMIKAEVDETFRLDSEKEIELDNGAKLKFQPNSVIDGEGNTYSEDIRIKAHWYNPKSEDLAETMPGDLRGKNLENLPVQLTTFGMMAVELVSSSGEMLNLRESLPATLYFPIHDLSNVSESMPLWYLDETSGWWVQEGEANKIGDFLVAEVTHFSFWNCDLPNSSIFIRGRLLDKNNDPLPNQKIRIDDLDSNMTGTSTTNESGTFRAMVPENLDLLLLVNDCNEEKVELKIGPLSQSINLGDFILENFSLVNVSGTLLDCQSQPLGNAYVEIIDENRSEIFVPNQDGELNVTLPICTEELKIIAYNIATRDVSVESLYTVKNGLVNFSELTVCDGIFSDEYITFSIENQGQITLTEATVSIIDGKYVHIYGEKEGSAPEINYISLFYPMDPNQPNLVKSRYSIALTGENGYVGGAGTSLGNLSAPNSISKVGDLIFGQKDFFDFKLTVDRFINSSTIKAKVWFDENQDGIYNNSELPIPNISIIDVNHHNDASWVFLIGPYPITNAIGEFEISTVIPDFYYSLQTYQKDFKVSIPNQGSDENIDSDFEITDNPGGNQFQTHRFLIRPGEEISNLGLGLYPSFSISGHAWIDAPGGTPNNYDSNDEVGLTNLELLLLNSSDEVVSTMYTDPFGRYHFENLSFESYRIQVNHTDEFEIVEQGDLDEQSANHIDPNTNLSYELDLQSFDSKSQIVNIGLKRL